MDQSHKGGPTLTERFADCILAVRFAQLPADVIEVARNVAMDGLAVMLAGSLEPLGLGRMVIDYVRESGGTPQASLVAGGFRSSMANAAFANGTLAHALDFDNTFYPLNHPTSTTLPAILAIAEARQLPGEAVIEALVVGLEVQGRLRMAATGLDTGKGFHKPGTTGTIGATAAAAKLLGLNRQQLLMALGLAGSRAGSLSINTGSMTKSSHSGHAARMGVECAILAGKGWTASADLFGPGGFFDAFAKGIAEPELMVEGFGKPFRMVDPGIGFKKYPSNYFTHRPVDAALALRKEFGIQAEQIATVEVTFPSFDYVDRPQPTTGLDGKFSVQYTTAAALLDGRVTVASFSNERRFAPDMVDLLPRVSLIIDSNIPRDFARMHIELRIILQDGRILHRRQQELSGFIGHPLSREQRLGKVFDCAEGVIPRDSVEQLIELIERLETLDKIGSVMDLVRTPLSTEIRV